MGTIGSFAADPEPGDPILLRIGQEVVAIGHISNDEGYSWDERFDDVLGWDLQHCRRVQWEPGLTGDFPEVAGVFEGVLQRPTFSRVHLVDDHIVRGMADAFVPRPLRPLPEVGPILTSEQLGIELFSAGVGNDVADHLILTLAQVRRLLAWYRKNGGGVRPSEHEVVAHVVVPLLKSLGWAEQLVGVEWNHVDVALFDQTPTTEDHCIAVVEVKGVGQSLDQAYQQARGYVEGLGLARCRAILTTDGGRLLIYHRRDDGEWDHNPSGYLNCSTPRSHHLLPTGSNSADTIVRLLPGRLGQQA